METTKWGIDNSHSEIQFKVKHLMISSVTGYFKQFDASLKTKGEDFSTSKVSFSADVNSISTNNDQRDAHLKNGDFFDIEKHPKLVFESSKLEKIDEENYKLFGNLTIKGISKAVILNVEFGGLTQDPWGNTRVGFSATGKINRQDFGINFGMVSETGGVLLGDEVKISVSTEFIKEKVADAQLA